MPLVPTRLVRDGMATETIEALIDTGAICTVFSASLLEGLGLRWDALELRQPIEGVGGGAQEWRGTRLELHFGNLAPMPRIVLREARVFFSKQPLPARIRALVGQDDALYRLQFEQCNRAVERLGRSQPPSFRLIEP